MKNKKKDNDSKIAGTIGTIVVHALLLLLLLFTGIIPNIPETEAGLTVNYGTDMDMGEGLYEPAPQSAIEDQLVEEPKVEPVAPAPTTTPSEPDIVEEELETQDIEESIEVKKAREEAEKKRKEEEKRLAEEKRKAEEEAKRIAEEKRKAEEEAKRIAEEKRKAEEKKKAEEAKKQQIANQLKGAFGAGSNTSSTSQGNSGTAGNKGDLSGSANSNAYQGGGSGNGHSYSLGGRSLQGGLPTPQYNRNEEGVIVVSIEVNPAGTVVSAKAGALGTTIIDASLRKEAERAAMKAKFNAIGGTTIQSGTITYRYKLN